MVRIDAKNKKVMKALSIKQPWASLIAHGIKDIENRTWKTKFRGRIYVHASGKPANEPYQIFTDNQWKSIEEKRHDFFVFHSYSELSQIIGEVDIVDCVINHESIWAEAIDMEFEHDSMCRDCADSNVHGICDHTGKKCDAPIKPIYNWVLANPVLYDKPIPCKGKLSFWEPDIFITECIGCDGKFNIEEMSQDDAGEDYCPECWEHFKPLLQAEYDELKANGEID